MWLCARWLCALWLGLGIYHYKAVTKLEQTMSKLFFDCNGEPRIVEQQLTTQCRVSKLSPNVLTPKLDMDQSYLTLFVHPEFNALLPPNHRVVVNTGIVLHFDPGFMGVIYGIPNDISTRGMYVVSQLVKSGDSINIVVFNFGDMDRAIFGEMAIAHIIIKAVPRISSIKPFEGER